jgi:hypothetical protein
MRLFENRVLRIWAGHLARMRRKKHVGYWWESQKETDY